MVDNDKFDTAENQISIDRSVKVGQSLYLTGNNLSSFLVAENIGEIV